MAADEYMRTRRTRVGIWLVAMASLETANGREHGTTSTRRKTRLPNTREKLHGPR
jgi:1,2-phenylacetyl-CoA epoxidase PaaB subunit